MTAPGSLRIGYSTLHDDPSGPGDRRRFLHYAARRGLTYDLAQPDRRYDVVISNITGDLSVWSRLPRPTRLVLDLVDSYLAVPSTDVRGRLRGAMKFAFGHTRHLHLDFRALIEASCRRADAVICTTEEQRERILPFCSNVHVILDFQSGAVRRVKSDYARGEVFNLVWEGLAGNLKTFTAIAAVLDALAKRRRLAVHLVTDLELALGSTHVWMQPTQKLVRRIFAMDSVYLYQWNAETFSAIATACDLAVIPIPLEIPFMAGKPENKLVLFWRLGLPVVTSATAAYARAMRSAGLEMTCRTADDWAKMLERLMDDEAARREAGQRGMAYANQVFSEERLLAKWDQVFGSLQL